MKTAIKSIIVIAVLLLCGSCTKIVYEAPETFTISGHITDEYGQPIENVGLTLMCIQRGNLLGFYVGTGIDTKTDADGYYFIEFENNDDYSYRMDIGKAGYHYVQGYSVDRWIASQQHDVVMIKKEEYIDLGLPSRTLWTNCNVGTNKPEGLGESFAWGETSPKINFSWANYEHCNGAADKLTKYCNDPAYGYNQFTDTLTELMMADDASWHNFDTNKGPRIPTREQWRELYQNTTHTWTTLNGVEGVLFEASNGNSIFLPAGRYWLNSLGSIPVDAWSFKISSELDTDANTFHSLRCTGLSVRPVAPYGWPFCPTN